MFGSTRLAAVCCGACYLASAAVRSTPWLVARTSAFEVFTDAGPQTARSTLLWFEELRAFFTRQTGLAITAGPPVRVIVFRSTQEYSEFRPRPEASAFYAGMGAGNYVVMEQSGVNWPGIAAHEYAHCLMHANGVAFPAWLSEGLAEVFSTVRIGEHASTIGSALPSRLQTLGRGDWIPLPALLSTPDDTNAGNRFYAQSWALAHMLVFSPEYSRFFPALIASGGALSHSCGKPLDAIARDLRAWVENPSHFQPITLGGLSAPDISIQTAELSSFERRRVLADLLLTSTEFGRAAAMYEELRREAPADKEVIAALGEIAVHNGDRPAALRAWKHAVDLGTRDPKLCMRYVALAQQAGAPETEIRPVLERVLALDPSYDEARYQLALIDINTGDFDGGVRQLRAMKHVTRARQYSYWSTMANALNELDRREEAKAAAAEADRHAATPEEHAHAAQLAYIAATDLTVQFARDASGRAQMVTTRTAHGSTEFNPFVEPGDHMRRVEGTLGEIDCSGPVTRVAVQAGGEKLTLSIPDPGRVRMLHAPAEFTCGPQSARVIVDYATQSGVVRSIDFK